jgi:aryl-alcohol dehydrogenase-like predicted oxidoreductase
MSTQLTLQEARARRDAILEQLDAANGLTFSHLASAFVLAHLRRHGPTSGETLTDACKAAGIVPATSDKAFGAIFAKLARDGRIYRKGWTQRAKAHGTGGATIWAPSVVRS